MIRSFHVAGFKPFGPEGLNVDLAPLTVLVGRNGSGKTSFFEAMGVLAQSASRDDFRWGDDPGADETWVHVLGPPDCLHGRQSDVELTLAFELDLDRNRLDKEMERAPAEVRAAVGSDSGRLLYRVSHRKLGYPEEWEHRLTWGALEVHRAARVKSQVAGSVEYDRVFEATGLDPLRGAAGDDRGVLSKRTFQIGDDAFGVAVRAAQLAVELAARQFREQFSYIGTERGPSFFEREIPAPDKRTVGKRGQHTLRLLARVFSSDRTAEQADRIRRWSEKFGLARLSAGWGGGKWLGCDFRDDATGAVISFNLSGFGSQQLLPIIVELFAAPVPATILIEEPEISLHPQAIAILPVMLAESVKEGRQVIVSTHSEALLQDLHLAVSEGGLDAGSIRVVEFSRSHAGVSAQPLALSKEGLIQGWVPSFVEAENRSAGAWADKVGSSL